MVMYLRPSETAPAPRPGSRPTGTTRRCTAVEVARRRGPNAPGAWCRGDKGENMGGVYTYIYIYIYIDHIYYIYIDHMYYIYIYMFLIYIIYIDHIYYIYRYMYYIYRSYVLYIEIIYIV